MEMSCGIVAKALLLIFVVCTTADQHTKPCCAPKQWEAKLLDLKSLHTSPYGMWMVHDDDLKREAAVFLVPGGNNMHIPVKRVVKDFNTMTTYTSDVSAKDASLHKCTKSKLTEKFITSCASFESLGVKGLQHHSHAFLGMSPTTVSFEGWSYRLDEKDYVMGLSPESCLPVWMSVKSTPKAAHQVDNVFLYTNATASIVTPTLLDIPAECN